MSECQDGVVAVLDMVGYTDFIQKLAQKKVPSCFMINIQDVSCSIIARSIEVHFATVSFKQVTAL